MQMTTSVQDKLTLNYRKLENMEDTEVPRALIGNWTVATPNMSNCTVVRASEEQVKEEDKEGGDYYMSQTSDCGDQVTGDSLVQVPIDPSCETEVKPCVASMIVNLSEDVPSVSEGMSSIHHIKQEYSSEVLEDVPSMVEGKSALGQIKQEHFSEVLEYVSSNLEGKSFVDHIKQEDSSEVLMDVPSVLGGMSSLDHIKPDSSLFSRVLDVPSTIEVKPLNTSNDDVKEEKLAMIVNDISSNIGESPSIVHIKEENCSGIIKDVASMIKGESSIRHRERGNLLELNNDIPCDAELKPSLDHVKLWSENLLGAHANPPCEMEVKPGVNQNWLELNKDFELKPSLDHVKKWSEEQDVLSVAEAKPCTCTSLDYVKEENLSVPCEMEVKPGVDQNLLEASEDADYEYNNIIEVKPVEDQITENMMDIEDKGADGMYCTASNICTSGCDVSIPEYLPFCVTSDTFNIVSTFFLMHPAWLEECMANCDILELEAHRVEHSPVVAIVLVAGN